MFSGISKSILQLFLMKHIHKLQYQSFTGQKVTPGRRQVVIKKNI